MAGDPLGDAARFRRPEAGDPGADRGRPTPLDELAAALTLTSRGADTLLDFTRELSRLPLSGVGASHGTDSQRADSGTGPTVDWAMTVTIRPLAIDDCGHTRESTGYRPSPSLRHAISTRQRTCGFPGCRRAATRCDLDHTIPYASGGRTCECGLAPAC